MDDNPSDLIQILESILELYEDEPYVLVVSAMATVLSISAFLGVIVYAITRAGELQPPLTVMTIVLSLLGLLSIVGVIVRPDVDSLAVAAGAAIGALGSALANEAQFRRRVASSIPIEDAAIEEVLDDLSDPGGPTTQA